MSNSDERRWQQRLVTFGTALVQLTDACDRERYDYLELTGLIKTFEFNFELSWKVLKDFLFYEGYDVKAPRAVIRKSSEVDYIDESDCEILLDALDKRKGIITQTVAICRFVRILDTRQAQKSMVDMKRKISTNAPGHSHRKGVSLPELARRFPDEDSAVKWFKSVLMGRRA